MRLLDVKGLELGEVELFMLHSSSCDLMIRFNLGIQRVKTRAQGSLFTTPTKAYQLDSLEYCKKYLMCCVLFYFSHIAPLNRTWKGFWNCLVAFASRHNLFSGLNKRGPAWSVPHHKEIPARIHESAFNIIAVVLCLHFMSRYGTIQKPFSTSCSGVQLCWQNSRQRSGIIWKKPWKSILTKLRSIVVSSR